MFSHRLGRGCVLATVVFSLAVQPAAAFETDESPREVREYWTPERMASALPGDTLLQDAKTAVPDVLGLGIGAPEPARAQAEKVGNPKSKPFRTHGKAFFTLGALNYVCSGTSVKSDTKSLVVTAGHCIYSEAD